MQAWMEGYESDIEYTAGYYREQEPDFLNLCAVLHGIEPISLDKGFTYCELGCGQGMTALIMAANYPQGKFYAVDFNPSHIARARNIAAKAGLKNIVFLEKSFAQLADEPDLLPEFDFIVLHGIFTWVSDENRQHILDICKYHLRSGGMVYNSYNAKPGWSMGEPFQKMLFAAGKLFSGNSINRFNQALGVIKELDETKPRFFAINQEVVKGRLDLLSSNDKKYLVHEYFHEGWRAFYFTEVAEYMASAKLEFVGQGLVTATYVQKLLPEKSQKLLEKIPDVNVQELFKDVMLNTMFRKDLYARGISGRLDGYDQLALLSKTQWALLRKGITSSDKDEFKFTLPIGEVSGRNEVYQPIIDCLLSKSASFSEIQHETGLPAKELIQALLFLLQENWVSLYYQYEATPVAVNLNKVIADYVLSHQKSNYIALPAMRSSIPLSMVEMLFYRAVLVQGVVGSSATLVSQVASQLEQHNLKLSHQGKELMGDAMRARLYELEHEWRSVLLPILRKGGALDID